MGDFEEVAKWNYLKTSHYFTMLISDSVLHKHLSIKSSKGKPKVL